MASRGLVCIVLLVLLSACGQKGDLYFPKQQVGLQSIKTINDNNVR